MEVSLEFARDGEGSVIRGRLGTRLVLSCQRCLERLEWRMSVPVETRVAGSEAEEAVAGHECVLLDEDGEISLAAFVEDELLLALPEFPRHDEAECGVDMEQYQAPEDERHENPFAALAGLKRADPS